MKIASFKAPNGIQSWGIINDETQTILSAADLEEMYFTFLPETIDELIEQGDEGLLSLATALEKHKEEQLASEYDLQDVVLTKPLQVKRNVICLGLNYDSHVKEYLRSDIAETPADPIFFTKRPSAVIGPDEYINLHRNTTSQVDYEGELGVIIGKRGSHIPEDEAYDYIFGYTIINDVTARDLQKKHIQWFLGKSLDTFCPMGPAVFLGNKEALEFTIQTHVNGELRQSGSSEDMICSIPKILAILSRGMTLEPGDVIATGTPFGVGMGFNPPRFLESEDEVAITISHVGTLKNTVR